jgi:uncharacterized small protein (DUF1192 family)
MSPHPPISESLWNTVPPEARAALLDVFGSLERRITELEKQIAELQARLNLDSTNSSGRNSPPALVTSLPDKLLWQEGVAKVVPLRQNIGYQASMFSPTKGTAMILTQEQALLKAQDQLQKLLTTARSAAEAGQLSVTVWKRITASVC